MMLWLIPVERLGGLRARLEDFEPGHSDADAAAELANDALYLLEVRADF